MRVSQALLHVWPDPTIRSLPIAPGEASMLDKKWLPIGR